MKLENNTIDHLNTLLDTKQITYSSYLFRLKANQLNIKTYQLKK